MGAKHMERSGSITGCYGVLDGLSSIHVVVCRHSDGGIPAPDTHSTSGGLGDRGPSSPAGGSPLVAAVVKHTVDICRNDP